MTDDATSPDDFDEAAEIEAAKEIWARGQGEEPASDPDQPRDERGRYAVKEQEKEPSAEPVEAEAAPDVQPEKPSAETPPEAEGVKAPGHLPREIREIWGDLSDAQRQVISEAQNGYSVRLKEAETMKRSVGPVYDRVLQAAKEMPALADMTPDQIADEVFSLAKWANYLQRNPVEALVSIAQHNGVAEELKAHFTGEAPAHDPMAALMQKITDLEQRLQQRPDPSEIENTVSREMEIARLNAEVQTFAKSKPDWQIVEPHIVSRLPDMRAENPQLSPLEVLELTYETVSGELLGPLKSAAATEADKARKAAAARDAASINVQPEGAGDPGPLTEEQAARAAWDKHHA